MDSLVAANIRQRPVRAAVSILGVALGVVLIVLNVGLARGLIRDHADREANVQAELRFASANSLSIAGATLTLPERYADAIVHGVTPSPDYPDIEPKPPIQGVTAVTPVGEYVQTGAGGIGFLSIDGIDYPSFVKTTSLHILDGRGLNDGAAYEAIIDAEYSNHNLDSDGNPVHVGSSIALLGHDFTVVGVYDPPLMSRVKIPLRTMQELLGSHEDCSFLMIKLDRPEIAEQAKASIDQYYPGNMVILTRDLPALFSHSIGPVEVFLDVVIWLAVVISTLVILLAMHTTITERTREIGILKSLGASKSFIVASIEKEALVISALGVGLGFVASFVAKYVIEGNTQLKIDLQPKWLLISALIGLLAGVLGALYPAFSAASMDPIEALSYE
jgi:putative ABC transport system permease protein